jgi:hypothetical protein
MSSTILTAAEAQPVDSALMFYPLHIGNQWQFHYRVGPAVNNYLYYYTLSVDADTLMPNGKMYLVEVERRPSYSITYYLRIDSIGTDVFRYLGPPWGEVKVDSLRSSPGDFFGCTCHPPLIWCYSVDSDTILGLPTVVKRFAVGVDRSYALAFGLGPMSFYSVDETEFPAWSDIVYAKIDGKEFGSFSSAGDPLPRLPKTVELLQNYPNPFNPSTTIRYALPERMHVTLAVFNTLGQVVATLVNENQDAGFHDVRFDGSGLASGVYFYRMQAGDFVQTRKLVLLR